MEKIYVLILLTLLQDVFTHPQVRSNIEVKRAKRNEADIESTLPGITQVTPGQFPHLAAIGFSRRNETPWFCSGTLLNKRFVLTVAHCLGSRLYGEAVYVRLGDIVLKDPSDDANVQEIDVIERIAHPDYKYRMVYNDIGLLKLKEDAIFNQFVKPACLHETYDITQTQAEVVGWGVTELDIPATGQTLLKVGTDLHHLYKCKETVNRLKADKKEEYMNDSALDDSMICAGVVAGGKGFCNGHSGSPLQVHSNSAECGGEVIGIASFGLVGCESANRPALYTRVSHYVPWIKSVINSS